MSFSAAAISTQHKTKTYSQPQQQQQKTKKTANKLFTPVYQTNTTARNCHFLSSNQQQWMIFKTRQICLILDQRPSTRCLLNMVWPQMSTQQF